MSELFQDMSEMGDQDKPKLVFFFDEAHLLFADAPPALLQKVEQTVKLIRSKGIGIYFVTQNPLDIPDGVLAQLGNRVQHALRAYTPRDQKALKAAATTFRANPKFDTEKAITELGKGEALVSVLDLKGVPTIVERTFIRPPSGQIGPVTLAQRQATIAGSPILGKYETAINRESAYEKLTHKVSASSASVAQSALSKGIEVATGRFAKTVVNSMARSIGSAIVRGVLGSLTRR